MARVAVLWVVVLGASAAEHAAAAPELDVIGAENRVIAFTSTTPEVKLVLTVVAQNSDPIGDVVAVVSPFRDAAGTSVGTEWTPRDKQTFRDSLDVAISATLTSPGEYKAVLALIYDKQRHPFTLRVTRPAAPTPAAPKDLAVTAVGGTVTDIVRWWADTERARITIRNDGTEPLTLNVEAAVALSRSNDLLTTGGKATTKPSTVTLASGQSAPIELELTGLDGAGKFEGKLRVTAAGYKAATIDFVVLAKRSFVWAGALIALGVLVSFGFNHGFNKRRTVLVAWRDLARVRERLAEVERATLTARERASAAAIRSQLDTSAFEARIGGDVSAVVVRAHRKVDILESSVRIANAVDVLDATKAAQLRSKLDAAAEVLRDTAATKEVLDARHKELAELNVRTEQALALRTGIDALRALARYQETWRDERLESVLASIAQADERLAKDDVDGASDSFRVARNALVPILVDHLQQRLETPITPPFHEAEWSRLKTELAPFLDRMRSGAADARIEAYRDAQARLYRRGFETIAVRAAELATRSSEHAATLTSFAARMTAAAETAAAADAPDRFEAARRELHTLESKTSEDARPFVVARGGSDWLPQVLPDVSAPAPAKSVVELQQAIDGGDRVAAVAILVIAVLSGLQLLWVGKTTWGDADSMLLAFLWGLGLHSVGNQPFKNAFHLGKLLANPPSG